MTAELHTFMCLSDNFGVLLHDPATRRTAAIDAPEAAPILKALDTTGWSLTDILVTHHHADHTQGLAALKAAVPNVRIVGPAKEAAKIPLLDETVGEGDHVMVGELKARIIETPGHTSGHIVYYFQEEDLLFAGDTLFALGCGRPFEDGPAALHKSLLRLAALPGSVSVYFGHEYTLGNARFARSVDPDNGLLAERAASIEALRAEGGFTIPTTLAIERATNPFLRADEDSVKKAIGMPDADPVDVFAALRERKNRA